LQKAGFHAGLFLRFRVVAQTLGLQSYRGLIPARGKKPGFRLAEKPRTKSKNSAQKSRKSAPFSRLY